MFKKFLIAFAGFALVVAALGFVKVAQITKMSSMDHSMPTNAVSTVDSVLETWAPVISSVGSLAPVQGVALTSETEGLLVKIAFENGAEVKAGDVLFEIDSVVETAQLQATEAQLGLAELNAKREVELREKGTNSQAELDQARATLAQLKASAASLKATIAKKMVRAPFDGRAGLRQVNVGQYISRGQALVQVQNLKSLYVNFSIPQKQVPSIATGEPVSISVDAFGDRIFSARVVATESTVDASTRNLNVQALLSNSDEVLRSGMFARVVVELPSTGAQIVIPETAVAYAAYGNSVYVVETLKNEKGEDYLGVKQKFVTLGQRKGDKIAVVTGLTAGEKVVSAGVFKLRNGLPVEINNTVQPSNSTDPKPSNS